MFFSIKFTPFLSKKYLTVLHGAHVDRVKIVTFGILAFLGTNPPIRGRSGEARSRASFLREFISEFSGTLRVAVVLQGRVWDFLMQALADGVYDDLRPWTTAPSGTPGLSTYLPIMEASTTAGIKASDLLPLRYNLCLDGSVFGDLGFW